MKSEQVHPPLGAAYSDRVSFLRGKIDGGEKTTSGEHSRTAAEVCAFNVVCRQLPTVQADSVSKAIIGRMFY